GKTVYLTFCEYPFFNGLFSNSIAINSFSVISYIQTKFVFTFFNMTGNFSVFGLSKTNSLIWGFDTMIHNVSKYMDKGFCKTDVLFSINIDILTGYFKISNALA